MFPMARTGHLQSLDPPVGVTHGKTSVGIGNNHTTLTMRKDTESEGPKERKKREEKQDLD